MVSLAATNTAMKRRLQLFKQLKTNSATGVPATEKITIQWDGQTIEADKGSLSASDIFRDQAKNFHFAKVKLQESQQQAYLYDLYDRPIDKSCVLEGVKFDQESFWHSSAHLLGYAIEMYYSDAQLTVGPPIDEGFFYDFQLLDGQVASQ